MTLEAGWRGVYGIEADDRASGADEDAEGGELPRLEEGMTIRCVEAVSESKETRPPPRYTEATLLSAMETAGKLVSDEELREAMKESGLGTPATRAEVIETLIRREYIERVAKDLLPTPKGLQVVSMLDSHPLLSPELTGDWEKRLSDIEHGSGDRAEFMNGVADFTRQTVEQIAALDKEKLRPERAELGLCPRCGAVTGEIIRENSRAYGCTSWKSREEAGCGFVIWKQVAGRTITPEIARQLLEEGRTKRRPLRLPQQEQEAVQGPSRHERGREGRVRLSRARRDACGRGRGGGVAATPPGYVNQRLRHGRIAGLARESVVGCERYTDEKSP